VARLKRERVDSVPFRRSTANPLRWEGSRERMLGPCLIELSNARWFERETDGEGRDRTLGNLFFSRSRTSSSQTQKKNSSPERLDELRALNRKTFEETGEYMTEEEIRAFRQPRWTDRREFQDDD
jgi:hypothetical protein